MKRYPQRDNVEQWSLEERRRHAPGFDAAAEEFARQHVERARDLDDEDERRRRRARRREGLS